MAKNTDQKAENKSPEKVIKERAPRKKRGEAAVVAPVESSQVVNVAAEKEVVAPVKMVGAKR